MATAARYRATGPADSQAVRATGERSVDPQARADKRSADEQRRLFLQTGVVSQAAGSSYMEAGRVRVICAVHGPRPLPSSEYSEVGQVRCEVRFAPFGTGLDEARVVGEASAEERVLSLFVQSAVAAAVRVEAFPKSLVDVFVHVLQADGGTAAAATTCASMALADAGIEMRDLVIGSSVALFPPETLLLDPTADEEAAQQGTVTMTLMPQVNEVTQVSMNGAADAEHVATAMNLCLDACVNIHGLVRQCLVDAFAKKA